MGLHFVFLTPHGSTTMFLKVLAFPGYHARTCSGALTHADFGKLPPTKPLLSLPMSTFYYTHMNNKALTLLIATGGLHDQHIIVRLMKADELADIASYFLQGHILRLRLRSICYITIASAEEAFALGNIIMIMVRSASYNLCVTKVSANYSAETGYIGISYHVVVKF